MRALSNIHWANVGMLATLAALFLIAAGGV